MNAKVDTSRLRRKLRALRADRPEMAAEAVKIMAGDFIDRALELSPRDTNRYAAGWAQAGNSADVGVFAVPPIKTSRYADRLEARLQTQLVRWEKRLESEKKYALYWQRMHESRYLATNRHDKWERDLLRKKREADKRVAKVQKLVDRAREQLKLFAEGEGALVIWGRKLKSEFALGQLATVRNKVYGGTGSVNHRGENTSVTLHNLEPHSRIVERQHRVVARGVAAARSYGARRAQKAAKARAKRKSA